MPKICADNKSSNDTNNAELKKAYFMRFQGYFVLIADEFYKRKTSEKTRK